jgi:hypothetical protein
VAEELSPDAFRTRFDAGTNVTVGTGGASGSGAAGSPVGPGTGSSTTTTATTSTTTTSGSSGSGTGGSGGAVMDASTDARGGGAGGGAGTGGSGSGGSTTSDGGFVNGFQVLYANMQTSPSSAYMGCELHAKSGAQGTIPVEELKLRYYFTNDFALPPQFMLNWSHISTSGAQGPLTVTTTVNALMPATSTADTYFEFSLSSPGHPNLAPNESADFSWQVQGPDPSKNKYTQTNDYSWDAGKTSPQPWDHVVLVRNGIVLWGTPP